MWSIASRQDRTWRNDLHVGAEPRLHVYARGNDNHLYEGYKPPTSGWQFIKPTEQPGMGGMQIANAPTALLFPSNDLHVYAKAH